MKIKFISLALMLLIAVDKLHAQKKVYLVKIEYAPFLTESIDGVDCESFRIAFKNSIRSKTLKETFTINRIELLQKHFVKRKSKNIDVRGILTINYGATNIQYCFDRYGYFEKDGIIFYNKKLLDFLNTRVHFW